MPKINKIYKLCDQCKGTGKIISPPEGSENPDCPVCKGKGHFLWGAMKEEEE